MSFFKTTEFKNSVAKHLTEEKSQPCNSHSTSEYIYGAVHKLLVYHKESVNLKQLFFLFFSRISYQNKFGIKSLPSNGGSYPYASFNATGNTATNDYCKSVGVMTKVSTAPAWSQNANGYDSPASDSGRLNRSVNHQSPHLKVWLK